MARRPDIMSAMQRLGRYVARDEWLTPREAYVLLLVEPILDEYALTLPQLAEELAAADALDAMLTFIDESFFGLEAGPDGNNAVDDYLRRRGWQESPRAGSTSSSCGRRYLRFTRCRTSRRVNGSTSATGFMPTRRSSTSPNRRVARPCNATIASSRGSSSRARRSCFPGACCR